MIARILIALAFAAAAIFSVRGWESATYKRGYAAAEADLRAASDRKLLEQTDAVLTRERELNRALNALHTQTHQERQQHEKAVNDLRARVRAGDDRLRIAVAATHTAQCAASGDSGTAAPLVTETHADVLPAVADAVLSIAADFASSVRDYNELLEHYELARAACKAL